MQETLFIVDKAKLFGTEAGPIFQRINTKEGSLSNEITFPPDGSFNVSAIITKDGQQASTRSPMLSARAPDYASIPLVRFLREQRAPMPSAPPAWRGQQRLPAKAPPGDISQPSFQPTCSA